MENNAPKALKTCCFGVDCEYGADEFVELRRRVARIQAVLRVLDVVLVEADAKIVEITRKFS